MVKVCVCDAEMSGMPARVGAGPCWMAVQDSYEPGTYVTPWHATHQFYVSILLTRLYV